MSLLEIIQMLRLHLSEPIPIFFTDEELMLYINFKARDIAYQTKVNRKYVSLGEGDGSYTLPVDLLTILSVERGSLDTSNREFLPRINPIGRNIDKSTSYGYFVQNNAIETHYPINSYQTYPRADYHALGSEIILNYIYSPREFVDVEIDSNELLDLPQEATSTLISGVLYECYYKQEKFQNGDRAKKSYEDGLKDLNKSSTTKFGVQSISVLRS